jgi:hypothetical protein
MKVAKLIGCFVPGILAVLLAGCFNPITAVPPKGLAGGPAAEPFTVTVQIGEGQDRSLAGMDNTRLSGGGGSNFAQLIVVDKVTSTIVEAVDVRRKNTSSPSAEFKIVDLPFGKEYHFMVLMGSWPYSMNQDVFEYEVGVLPTLLDAGFTTATVGGPGPVTVTMWPIVVDTKFTTATLANLTGSEKTIEPVRDTTKPGTATLLPVDKWGVAWKMQKGSHDDWNGFEPLLNAQIAINSQKTSLLFDADSSKAIIRGTAGVTGTPSELDTALDISVAENVVTLASATAMDVYTKGIARVGSSGSINFNLVHIPFGNLLTGWSTFSNNSNFDLSGSKKPMWIIRNGVNDFAQDTNTTFVPGSTNENGAVRFTIAAKFPASDQDLVIADPKLEANNAIKAGTPRVTIGFSTSGYTGPAEVRYAVVAGGAPAPDTSAYTGILKDEDNDFTIQEEIEPGTHTLKAVYLPKSNETGYNSDADYDVYVRLLKDGVLSNAIYINTARGEVGIIVGWGN